MNDKFKDLNTADAAHNSLRPLLRWNQERGSVSRRGISKFEYTQGSVETLVCASTDKIPFGLAQNFNGYRLCCTIESEGIEFKRYSEDGLMTVPSPSEVEIFKSNVSAVIDSNPAVKAFLAKNPKFWSAGPL